jgi:hypothetical protein
MRDRDYYPAGAYSDPNAPFNQHDPDPIEVSIGVTVTLTHETTVETTNYANGEDGDELLDGYGELNVLYGEQHMTIPQLLDELKKYIKGELAGGNVTYSRKQELVSMLLDCEGWTQEETEVDNVY